jgi:hypothetical protein
VIGVVAVLLVAAGVGAYFLWFNKPATPAGTPSTTATTATSSDAAAIVAKLNAAITAGDSAAWDALWDGKAVAEYARPLLLDAAENGAAWSTIVDQVGSQEEAVARLESVLTVSMLEAELGRALFDAKGLFGAVKSSNVSGNTATVITVDAAGDEITLKLEKRATGWVVVGFDSEAFITGFVTSFESSVLGQ